MRVVSPIQTNFTITSASDLATDIKLIDQTGADVAPNTDYTFTFDLSGGATTLDLTALDAINLDLQSKLTIIGNGDTIDGQGTQRGLFVYSGAVRIEDLKSLTRSPAAARAGPAPAPVAAVAVAPVWVAACSWPAGPL